MNKPEYFQDERFNDLCRLAIALAEYFYFEDRDAEDLKSAILTTMHIRLES
ncbi:hypothetical protein PMG71_09620 [Roseofilum sp. BLCC_M154]|uniref:Uncharacterized protein n=1 Tax=Roseofilum acuticapitatum BLCC-M154 TaxID=3022444 RepID=A0ABT7ATD0_9CYAN|nr:hypothetical protein [Roseofilum acuticapitatum]MDJ1169684.1 hypothetical protein [Roseofilum acuticapitatum BLCC-M154]